jgi:hypothetical protein
VVVQEVVILEVGAVLVVIEQLFQVQVVTQELFQYQQRLIQLQLEVEELQVILMAHLLYFQQLHLVGVEQDECLLLVMQEDLVEEEQGVYLIKQEDQVIVHL